MRSIPLRLLLGFLCLTLLAAACAQKAPTPPAGSAERKKIIDALRPALEKDLKQKVIFQVDHLKVRNGWAFVTARPLRPDGKRIDYRRTGYQAAVEAGAFDEAVNALLAKKRGRWKLVVYNLGATDVVWEPWPKKYGAPKSIFPG